MDRRTASGRGAQNANFNPGNLAALDWALGLRYPPPPPCQTCLNCAVACR